MRSPAASSAEASADCPAVSGPGGGPWCLGRLRRRAGERPHQRTDAVHVGVPAALAGEDQTVAAGVGARGSLGPAAGDRRGHLLDVEQRLGAQRVGRRGRRRLLLLRARAVPSRMPLEPSAGRAPDASVTSEPETRTAATAVATPTAVCARRRAEPGPHHDRGPRPADRLQCGRERLEHASDRGGRDLAVHGELRARRLQLPLGTGAGDADLARHVVDRQRGQVGQQKHLALRGRQLPQCVQRGAGLGVDVLLPGPPAGAAAALGPGPGQRAHVVLGPLEPRHLSPVVPGHDHGVADGALSGEQVAGQRVGLEEQPAPDVLVEGFEAFGTPRVRAGKRAGHQLVPGSPRRCPAEERSGGTKNVVGWTWLDHGSDRGQRRFVTVGVAAP